MAKRRKQRRAAKAATRRQPATPALADAPRDRKPSRGSKGAWKVLDRGSTLAAGLLATQVSQGLWRVLTGRKPPVNGRHPEVETREAVTWAIVGGALVEVVKILVRRYVSSYWVRSTGHLPPGMTTLSEPDPLSEAVDAVTPGTTSKRSRRKAKRSRRRR